MKCRLDTSSPKPGGCWGEGQAQRPAAPRRVGPSRKVSPGRAWRSWSLGHCFFTEHLPCLGNRCQGTLQEP